MVVRTAAIGLSAVAAASLAALALPAAAQAAKVKPVLKDGSFVTPAQGGIAEYARGQKFGPWRVAAGSIDLNSASTYSLPDGVPANGQSVDLNGSDAGAIRQTITTVPGTTYTLSFYLGGNPDGDPGVKTVSVLVDGTVVGSDSFDSTDSTPSDIGWVQDSQTFTAGSSTESLVLQSDTPGTPYGPLVTGLSVQVSAAS